MLKALFLDMDDTLCDTQKANTEAKRLTAIRVEGLFEGAVNGIEFADAYVKGIYRNWLSMGLPLIRWKTFLGISPTRLNETVSTF